MTVSTSTDAVRHLRSVLAHVAAGWPLTADDAAWLGRAQRYLDEAPTITLDDALGLAPGWGGKGWWTVEPKAQRDAAIARLDRDLFADLDVSAAARAIVALARRHRDNRPSVAAREAHLLADLTRTGGGVPGARQIARILARTRTGRTSKSVSNVLRECRTPIANHPCE